MQWLRLPPSQLRLAPCRRSKRTYVRSWPANSRFAAVQVAVNGVIFAYELHVEPGFAVLDRFEVDVRVVARGLAPALGRAGAGVVSGKRNEYFVIKALDLVRHVLRAQVKVEVRRQQ